MVRAKNLAKPSTIEWMSSYESAVLKRFGYSSAAGCATARLCPAFSLTDLFRVRPKAPPPPRASGQSGQTGKLTQADVSGLLSVIPPYFSQDVITADRRVATLAFGIRLMGLAAAAALIDAMRSSLHPPAGVSAQLVGLPVLAASSGAQVASPWRRIETLIAGLWRWRSCC